MRCNNVSREEGRERDGKGGRERIRIGGKGGDEG